MAERRVNVGWAEGLHARPASIFVRAATASGVPVTIAKAGGEPVNAASMLAVLGLGAQGGEEIVLASEADGAEAALDRLARLVADGLEELPETVCPRESEPSRLRPRIQGRTVRARESEATVEFAQRGAAASRIRETAAPFISGPGTVNSGSRITAPTIVFPLYTA